MTLKESLEAFTVVAANFEKKFAADPTDSTTHFRIAMAKEGMAKAYRIIGKSASAAEKSAAR